jgi:hypothetical protein
MVVSHQSPTVVNRRRRGVGARVVLGLAIVVARCGCFGATFEARGAEPTRVIYNLRMLFPPVLTRFSIVLNLVMRYLRWVLWLLAFRLNFGKKSSDLLDACIFSISGRPWKTPIF